MMYLNEITHSSLDIVGLISAACARLSRSQLTMMAYLVSIKDYTNGLFLTYTSGAITPNWLTSPMSLSFWGGALL